MVGDLDKSLGNSKDWMLQLRDGRQIVISLSFYRSLDSKSDCSVMKGEAGTSDNAFVTNRKFVSWTEERDKVLILCLNGSKDEL